MVERPFIKGDNFERAFQQITFSASSFEEALKTLLTSQSQALLFFRSAAAFS
jgi:hypothetical protein